MMNENKESNESAKGYISQAYDKIKAGDFSEASLLADRAHGLDFEDKTVLGTMKVVGFWSERSRRAAAKQEPFTRGEFLLREWVYFNNRFIRERDCISEACFNAVRQFVFGEALSCYKGLSETTGAHDPEILLRVGRCYKGCGDYVNAQESLEKAFHIKKDSPEILGELADCYALMDETRAAKVFFREAFFIDAQRVETAFMESGMFLKIMEQIGPMGFTDREKKEWLPVYGVVLGIFNVKRELRPIEFIKLKQSINSLRQELREGNEVDMVKPKMIYRFFWLIDHLISARENRAKVEEVLEELKELDTGIYDQYIN